MTALQPRFRAGEVVILDTGDHRFTGREFRVRAIERGKYQLAPADGQGQGVKDVPFDMAVAPGEPLRSAVWLHVGTTVRYTGEKTVQHKGTVILAPGDLGVIIGDKAAPQGDLIANVARLGGLDADLYGRLTHRHLDVVPLAEAAKLLAEGANGATA